MSNQSQVDALEHLLIAVLNSSIANGMPKKFLLETAQASLLGSNGPEGHEQKSEAVDYLNFIGTKIK